MTDVADIAAGLSEAERACLKLTGEVSIIDISLFAPNGSRLICKLRTLKLIGGIGDATSLTPLGLAVKAHLESTPR